LNHTKIVVETKVSYKPTKKEIFQIKLELSAGICLWFPKCCIIITIIHSGIRHTHQLLYWFVFRS